MSNTGIKPVAWNVIEQRYLNLFNHGWNIQPMIE